MHSHLAVGLFLATVACHSQPPYAESERDYTLVFLKTGPAKDLAASARQAALAGHFSNMERLARAGQLVLAGPFGEKRTDTALRGIFVLDAGDPVQAKALAETDPAVQAGMFALECHALRTAAPLPRFLAKDLAETDAQKAAGYTPKPGENARGFVLLIAADGDQAAAAIAGHAAVLLFGRYDAVGAFAIVDAVDLAAAEKALVTVRPLLGEHRLEEWYASRNVAELPRL